MPEKTEALAIEFTDDDTPLLEDHSVVPEATPADVLVQKLFALSNLMKADGAIAPEERSFLDNVLAHAELEAPQRKALRVAFDEPHQHAVDFTPFQHDEDEALGLMMDLVALAHRDGEFHGTEKLYVRQVARKLGFPEEDLDALVS